MINQLILNFKSLLAINQHSLFFKNKGIVAAWTGVDLINLKSVIVSNVSFDNFGSIAEKFIVRYF